MQRNTKHCSEPDCYSNEYVSGGGPYSAESHEHNNDDANGFAIVINGHSLVHCLHPKLEEKWVYL